MQVNQNNNKNNKTDVKAIWHTFFNQSKNEIWFKEVLKKQYLCYLWPFSYKKRTNNIKSIIKNKFNEIHDIENQTDNIFFDSLYVHYVKNPAFKWFAFTIVAIITIAVGVGLATYLGIETQKIIDKENEELEKISELIKSL